MALALVQVLVLVQAGIGAGVETGNKITKVTSGVDQTGLFGEMISWCQSDRVSP